MYETCPFIFTSHSRIGALTLFRTAWVLRQVLRKYGIEVQITDEELSAIAIQNQTMFEERRAAASASSGKP